VLELALTTVAPHIDRVARPTEAFSIEWSHSPRGDLAVTFERQPSAHSAAQGIARSLGTWLFERADQIDLNDGECVALSAPEERYPLLAALLAGRHIEQISSEFKALREFNFGELMESISSEADAALKPHVGSTPPPAEHTGTFVMTPLQTRIYEAIDGVALKRNGLAQKACSGEGSRLYKRGGIKELMAVGLVKNMPGLGYYRPNAPPQDHTAKLELTSD
jgi:hypothetical protein